MRVFFLMLGAYILGHAYILLCLKRAFGPGKWLFFPAVWLGVMAFLLVARFARVLRFDRDIPELAQQALFIWMALALFLMLCFAASEVIYLGGKAVSVFGFELPAYYTAANGLRVAALVALLLFAWSLHEARTPRVVRLSVATEKLRPGASSVRVVAVSDVHIAPLVSTKMLRRMAEAVSVEKPDIVISLGDMVDMDVRRRGDFRGDAEAFRSIPAPLGMYAVTGNHEAYQGREMSLAFMKDAGFRVLRGESLDAGGIRIAGVDDPAFARGYSDGTDDVSAVLEKTLDKGFVLLLLHQPVIPEKAVGRFDLALAGHTHGGQIWPGKYFTRSVYGFEQGLQSISKNGRESHLFITNGLGFWGPPVRFMTPPEVVVIDISPALEGETFFSVTGR